MPTFICKVKCRHSVAIKWAGHKLVLQSRDEVATVLGIYKPKRETNSNSVTQFPHSQGRLPQQPSLTTGSSSELDRHRSLILLSRVEGQLEYC